MTAVLGWWTFARVAGTTALKVRLSADVVSTRLMSLGALGLTVVGTEDGFSIVEAPEGSYVELHVQEHLLTLAYFAGLPA